MDDETPRTDAEEREAITGLGRCVGVNFARELERENLALRILLRECFEAAPAEGEIMTGEKMMRWMRILTECRIEGFSQPNTDSATRR